MASKSNPCRVVLCVDANGDYGIGFDEDTARANYEEIVQQLSECDGFRLVDLTVNVQLPVCVELTADVPLADAATVTVNG